MPKPYYQHAGITIYCGDCREVLPGLGFDVVVTDPPYGIGWSRGEHRGSRGGQNKSSRASKEHCGIIGDEDTVLRDEMLEKLQVPALVFGSFYAPFPANLKHVLVWQKSANCGVVGSTTGFRRDIEPIFLVGEWPIKTAEWGSIFKTRRSQSHICTETGHPHTKPVSLIVDLLDFCPTGSVLDPFCGSGSIVVASKLAGRQAIGIEIEERYCEIAAKRLSQEVLDLQPTTA